MTRFVEALEALAKATGAAVLVVHHMNKGSANSPEQSQDASRGSSALTDGVRWQMNLATFTAAEAKTSGIQDEERGFYLTATVTKNNYAPPQPKALFKRGDGGYLHMVELTSTKEVKTQDLKAKIVQLVTDEIKAGRTYSRTAFENAFGAEEGLLKVGKITVRKALIELVSTKRLSDEKKKLGLPKKAKLMVTPT